MRMIPTRLDVQIQVLLRWAMQSEQLYSSSNLSKSPLICNLFFGTLGRHDEFNNTIYPSILLLTCNVSRSLNQRQCRYKANPPTRKEVVVVARTLVGDRANRPSSHLSREMPQ